MLQRLLELRERVECVSVHAALTGVVQSLFVVGAPFVELVTASLPEDSEKERDPQADFDRVVRILTQARFIDRDTPVDETAGGRRRVRVGHPSDSALELPFRIKLSPELEPAAAVLHAFLLLRVRFQSTNAGIPMARVEASGSEGDALDTLYLIGDSFTERYPVSAEVERIGEKVRLHMTGQPPLVTGGIQWPRADYVRSRDASLLVRILRLALEGPRLPLAIPRQVHGELPRVLVRLPRSSPEVNSLRWMRSLHEITERSRPETAPVLGGLGEHFIAEPQSGGYVAAVDTSGATQVVPVRALNIPTVHEQIVDEDEDDATLGISFEAIGGAREIGANSYVYSFGSRRVLIDVGFDATKDGWLGLPELERLTSADVLILTHAHLDHVGSLPTLFAAFPNIAVYCTEATRAVLVPQLHDSATVSGYRFADTGEPPAIARGLIDSIPFERFRLLDYGVSASVEEIPGLSIEFQDAGHIIGSACVRMSFGGTTILHTGDISVEDQHLLRGMRIDSGGVEHVVMEGTYCGEPAFRREDRRAAVDKFFTSVEERLDAGGSILIPAFSLGRAQELVGMLVEWRAKAGRNFPIYTVGMVNKLNSISAAHPKFLPGLKGKPFSEVLEFPRVTSEGEQRRKDFADHFARIASQPSILIASHGMMAENTGSFMIGRAILTGEDQRHAIFLCGYMDPRTPGFRLRHQCDAPVIEYGMGELIARNIPSKNIQFHRLTAHASYEELCDVAVNVPTRSVTFIHGDGDGLEKLQKDVQGRLKTLGKDVLVRVPAIGERFAICRVPRPRDWGTANRVQTIETLGGGRRRVRGGLSISGLDEQGQWALIPVGARVVRLGLDLERVTYDAVERLRINRRLVFDRARGLGDLRQIEWDEIGPTEWEIDARDPSGREVHLKFNVSCGAELRPVRTELDATLPVLEFHVGGTARPSFVAVRDLVSRIRLNVVDQVWDETTRLLRVRLEPLGVGAIDDLQFKVRWPNGFEQDGPSLKRFYAEPRVQLHDHVAIAGLPCTLAISSFPAPVGARVGGLSATIARNSLTFTPCRPGEHRVEFEYRTRAGEATWREVGIVTVSPSASISGPETMTVGQRVTLTVTGVDRRFHEDVLVLRVGSTSVGEWSGGSGDYVWSGVLADDDSVEVTAELKDTRAILCRHVIDVTLGLSVNHRASVPIATVDGKHIAELVWRGLDEHARPEVAAHFTAVGFEILGWEGDTLRLRGKPATLGKRSVVVSARSVTVWTLDDLDLRLSVNNVPIGGGATLETTKGELLHGLNEFDGGPLSVVVDRVAPVYDSLSSTVRGNRVVFLHPGRFEVAVCYGHRRLAELSVEVEAPKRTQVLTVTQSTDRTFSKVAEASHEVSALPPTPSTAVLAHADGRFRVLHGDPKSIIEEASRFVSSQRKNGAKVIVTWPGLSLDAGAGELFALVRQHHPNDFMGHLPYPAPRGELVDSADEARRLREHRVLCSAKRHAIVDRGDQLQCVRCKARQVVQTNARSMWLMCQACGMTDKSVVLTLVELRASDVEVLFADYRMVRYLRSATGVRYAGAFARTVRCAACHGLQVAYPHPSPWNGMELQALATALSASWNPANVEESARRAARLVGRRDLRTDKNATRRLEELAQRLIDVGAVVNGEPTPIMRRLEHGVSVCCGTELTWARRRLAHVFLNVEEILQPQRDPALHPELSFGEHGVRQFLGLHV